MDSTTHFVKESILSFMYYILKMPHPTEEWTGLYVKMIHPLWSMIPMKRVLQFCAIDIQSHKKEH